MQIFKIFFIFHFIFILECRNGYSQEYKKTLNYDIQYSNLLVGKVSVLLKKNNKELYLTANSFSMGFIDYFYNYKSKISSVAHRKDKKWLPYNYKIESIYKNQSFLAKVSWNNINQNLTFKIDPPLDLKKVHKIVDKSLEQVIDPITGLMNLIDTLDKNQSCDEMFKIFDGRRRYNVYFKKIGNLYLNKDRPKSFSGNTIVCGLRIFPIGGHRLKSKWKPEKDKLEDIKVYFAKYNQNTMFPVRLDISRWFGTIVVRLLKDNI